RGLGGGSHRHKGCFPGRPGIPGHPPTPGNIHKTSPAVLAGATGVRRRGGERQYVGIPYRPLSARAELELWFSKENPGQQKPHIHPPTPPPALQTADEWSNLPKVTPLEHSIAQTPSQPLSAQLKNGTSSHFMQL
ncbi:mCG144880, partial [Mus musculus]